MPRTARSHVARSDRATRSMPSCGSSWSTVRPWSSGKTMATTVCRSHHRRRRTGSAVATPWSTASHVTATASSTKP